MVVEAIGGTGKSALTWQWTQDRAPEIIHGLAGQLWWSFYDGSASMTRFLREVLAHTSRRPMRDIRRLGRADLAAEVLTELRARPYLLVLDGFERLLAAYHRFDPSKVRDEDVEQDARSLIEPHAEDVVRALTAARPSRILISTRLMPVALQGRFSRQVVAGVRHLRLPGLTDDDTCELLGRLDVQGSPAAIAGFFGPLGNHPLLVGVVAGLVRDYRADPGGFDRWLADPTAGGAFAVPDLDLTQRRSHILAAALAGLQPGHRQLLGWISVLAGAVSWITLDAINPFRPEKPAVAHDQPEDAAGPFEADLRARAQLDAALTDLEKRGLLWWDRFANSYDLHPVIRAYAHDELGATDRVRANERVRDHFEALPPEDVASATSVEDISQTITIFRALVGAGREREASWLWAEFGNVLLVHLGALTTVVELLSPLARTGERRVRSDLAIAYLELGRYDAAASQNTTLLADALRDEGVRYLDAHLASLCASFVGTGSPAAAGRYRDLWAALNAAIGAERDGDLYLDCAAAAGREGRVDKARELLDRAERLGSDKASPWFEGDIEYWRLYLALVADKSLTHGQLAEATARGDSWGMRHELVNLRCRLFIQQGQLEQALAAAEEADQLGRNAGRVAAPAMTAFLLARLGRTDEASAAAEQALARLPRLHPADRPHYYLARAMHELGRAAESAEHARLAYGQAWADGPPYCYHWGLRDARDLLQALGEPIPDLPAASPRDVRVPLEAELRAFITKLASQRRR